MQPLHTSGILGSISTAPTKCRWERAFSGLLAAVFTVHLGGLGNVSPGPLQAVQNSIKRGRPLLLSGRPRTLATLSSSSEMGHERSFASLQLLLRCERTCRSCVRCSLDLGSEEREQELPNVCAGKMHLGRLRLRFPERGLEESYQAFLASGRVQNARFAMSVALALNVVYTFGTAKSFRSIFMRSRFFAKS